MHVIREVLFTDRTRFVTPCHEEEDTCMSYVEEDTCV